MHYYAMILLIIGAYLLGSIPAAYIAGRMLKGIERVALHFKVGHLTCRRFRFAQGNSAGSNCHATASHRQRQRDRGTRHRSAGGDDRTQLVCFLQVSRRARRYPHAGSARHHDAVGPDHIRRGLGRRAGGI